MFENNLEKLKFVQHTPISVGFEQPKDQNLLSDDLNTGDVVALPKVF
jgi:hypothetical protein